MGGQGQPGNSSQMAGMMGMMGGQPGSQSSSGAASNRGTLPATTQPPGNASSGVPRALVVQQGGNQAGAVYTYREGVVTPAAVAPNQSGKPAAATAYDMAIANTPAGVANRTTRAEPETERRLRSLEEKLDRVLKALDVPKADAPKDALPK